jgi:hypothetical protein
VKPVQIVVEIPGHLAPALKSAVELVSAKVGDQLSGPMESKRTQSYTDACIALGILRKSVNDAIVKRDPHLS